MNLHDYWESMYGSYTKVTFIQREMLLKFENPNWFEFAIYEPELVEWCRKKGMKIRGI